MRRPPTTPAELRAEITDSEATGVRAAFLVDDMQDKRRAALLAGGDAALATIEAALLAAERDRERSRLRLDELGRRLRAAEQAERDAEARRKRDELADVCRTRLNAAARADAAIAELTAAAAEWERLGHEIARRWTVDGHLDQHGALTPDFIDPAYPLRGAIPPALALMLRMQPATHPAHGPRPVAQTDPAARAVALLDEPPPAGPAAVPHEQPAGVSIRIGEVPPPRPEAPDDLGRLRRLFTPPTPRDPLAPPPRRL